MKEISSAKLDSYPRQSIDGIIFAFIFVYSILLLYVVDHLDRHDEALHTINEINR